MLTFYFHSVIAYCLHAYFTQKAYSTVICFSSPHIITATPYNQFNPIFCLPFIINLSWNYPPIIGLRYQNTNKSKSQILIKKTSIQKSFLEKNTKKEKSAKLRGILTFLIECGVFWLYCLFLALNNFFIQKLPLYYRAKSLMSTCFWIQFLWFFVFHMWNIFLPSVIKKSPRGGYF